MHEQFHIGLPKLHGRFCFGLPKVHRWFRMETSKWYLQFCLVPPQVFHSIKSHYISTVGEICWPLLVCKKSNKTKYLKQNGKYGYISLAFCHDSKIPNPQLSISCQIKSIVKNIFLRKLIISASPLIPVSWVLITAVYRASNSLA